MKYYLKILIAGLLTFTLISNTDLPSSISEEIKFPCGVSPRRINRIPLDTLKKFNKNQKSAYTVYQYWSIWPKKNLRIYFMDTNDEALKRKTLEIAKTWEAFCGIKFIEVDVIWESDIRIAFRDDEGYSSAVGIAAMDESFDNKATMSLQDLDLRPLSEFKRVILHEFGHALGLEHELQNPESQIQWDTSAVYLHYKTWYGWDSLTTEFNVLSSIPASKHSIFDPKSIMIYAVPAHLTKNKIHIPWPEGLSRIDEMMIQQLYPLKP